MKELRYLVLTSTFVLGTTYSSLVLALNNARKLDKPTRDVFRQNTTAHFVFSTVSGLLQHWPNTIYRNGHTFAPATIPRGTLLHHVRWERHPPPSPEYFAFDFDHSYIFSDAPTFVYTYSPARDLRVGYFDGTGASEHEGPRDLQDIIFNGQFIPPAEYDPWVHAESMCVWAKPLGLAGIVRMEPSFEAILCDINSDLDLVSETELVSPEMPFRNRNPHAPGSNRSISNPRQIQLGASEHTPIFPGPTIPAHPAPPGWVGKQRTIPDVIFEAVRAGMWHNHSPGETRVLLDYSGIISAYDEEYKSLARGRRGLPRPEHRLSSISLEDRERIRREAHSVLTRAPRETKINWQPIFQSVLDRYGARLEDLNHTLYQELDPVKVVATVRQKLLIILSPHMVLPQVKGRKKLAGKSSEPDNDWFERIYEACASHPTSGILDRSALTKQERLLASSIDGVQGEICATLTRIWRSAFDSEDRAVFAGKMVLDWRIEVRELMKWLDWHIWVKCDPPCKPGLLCVLTTWPWEVLTGREEVVPNCRNYIPL
ncbi:hypothetical protein RhiJN_13951 [Ceratobasidium sp. AG-Ba]|nr:hypothetical protein RhiJN_13951 [Ceratobasidium sp. AG-Ba]